MESTVRNAQIPLEQQPNIVDMPNSDAPADHLSAADDSSTVTADHPRCVPKGSQSSLTDFSAEATVALTMAVTERAAIPFTVAKNACRRRDGEVRCDPGAQESS